MIKKFCDFLKEYPTYYSFSNNTEMQYIFECILCTEENIIKMHHEVFAERPALAAVVNEIEAYYDGLVEPIISLSKDSKEGIMTRRAIGSMVSMIMRDFGFTSNGEKYLPYYCSKKYFSCGSVYRKTIPAKIQVVHILREITI